jgi:hypothetical protein
MYEEDDDDAGWDVLNTGLRDGVVGARAYGTG